MKRSNTGVPGVSLSKDGAYRAYATIDGRTVYGGSYSTAEQAAVAVEEMRRTGRKPAHVGTFSQQHPGQKESGGSGRKPRPDPPAPTKGKDIKVPSQPTTTKHTPCAGMLDAMFPDNIVDAREAAQVCEFCPIRLDCITGALERCERHGIWGGYWLRSSRDVAKARRETGWTDDDMACIRVRGIKYQVQIKNQGQTFYGGTWDTIEEARASRDALRRSIQAGSPEASKVGRPAGNSTGVPGIERLPSGKYRAVVERKAARHRGVPRVTLAEAIQDRDKLVAKVEGMR